MVLVQWVDGRIVHNVCCNIQYTMSLFRVVVSFFGVCECCLLTYTPEATRVGPHHRAVRVPVPVRVVEAAVTVARRSGDTRLGVPGHRSHGVLGYRWHGAGPGCSHLLVHVVLEELEAVAEPRQEPHLWLLRAPIVDAVPTPAVLVLQVLIAGVGVQVRDVGAEAAGPEHWQILPRFAVALRKVSRGRDVL